VRLIAYAGGKYSQLLGQPRVVCRSAGQSGRFESHSVDIAEETIKRPLLTVVTAISRPGMPSAVLLKKPKFAGASAHPRDIQHGPSQSLQHLALGRISITTREIDVVGFVAFCLA